MLALRRMQADILWLPLLTGRLAFAGVAVDGLKLKLERDKAGAGNWRFGLPRAPAAGRMVAPMMTALDVTDTHVTWRTSSAAILRIDLADAAVRGGQQFVPGLRILTCGLDQAKASFLHTIYYSVQQKTCAHQETQVA